MSEEVIGEIQDAVLQLSRNIDLLLQRQTKLEESLSLSDISEIRPEKSNARDSFFDGESRCGLRARVLKDSDSKEKEEDDVIVKKSTTRQKTFIGKLNDKFKYSGREDFDTWQFKVISYLKQFNAEKYLTMDLHDENPEEDAAVLHYLSCCCTGGAAKVLTVRKNAESACIAWEALEIRFGIIGERKLESLETRWENLRMEPNETGTDFVDRLLDLCVDFENEGATKTDRIKIRKLYLCLSDDYQTVKSAISSDEAKSGIHRWIKMIQYIDQDRADKEKRSVAARAMYAETKKETAKEGSNGDAQKTITCFRCKEKGHKSYECPGKLCFICKKTGHIAKNCRNGKANVAKTTTMKNMDEKTFIVDSGAFPTLVPSSMKMDNTRNKTIGKIEIANGEKIPVSHAGDLSLSGLGVIQANASDCMAEPLLSVSQCARELKLSVIFDDETVRFIDGKIDVEKERIKGEGVLDGDVYTFTPSMGEDGIGTAFVAANEQVSGDLPGAEEPIEKNDVKTGGKPRRYQQLHAEARKKWLTWHRILGHASAMERTVKKGEGIGLPDNLPKKEDCMDCLKAKQKRESFKTPKREHATYTLGESLHIDIWSATVDSIWDEKYWITIKE
jgi:hypothetical protein